MLLGNMKSIEKIKNKEEIILEIASDTVEVLAWEYDAESFPSTRRINGFMIKMRPFQ